MKTTKRTLKPWFFFFFFKEREEYYWQKEKDEKEKFPNSVFQSLNDIKEKF